MHNHSPNAYANMQDNPSQIKPRGECPKCDEYHRLAEADMEWCDDCHGLKGIPGQVYGWAGKWCSCGKNK